MVNEPLQIKNITIKNRIAVPPMVCFCWAGDDGMVTEKHLEHYTELAKGGAGLIIVEATAVTKRSRLHQTELGLWEDAQISGMKRIVDAIHENGAKAFVQLVHAGGNGIDIQADAPSTMPYREGITGHEMTKDAIDKLRKDFVAAALRAKEAGFDGVELHGCHGYLLSCFFSPICNKRVDNYGKDKALLAKEILYDVRAACGSDYIVGIRLAAFEPKLSDGIRNAKAIAELTDFLDISYGVDSDAEKEDGFPCSYAVYGAMRIKKKLPEMPVFGVHEINSAEDVENALGTGIDMADVGKAHLVDPSFAKHVINGESCGKCLHCKNYCRWDPPMMENEKAVCPGKVKFSK